MAQYILSLVSRWLLPSQISVEKRLSAMRDKDHDLERVMARRVYVRLRKDRYLANGSSGAESAI